MKATNPSVCRYSAPPSQLFRDDQLEPRVVNRDSAVGAGHDGDEGRHAVERVARAVGELPGLEIPAVLRNGGRQACTSTCVCQ